MPPMKHQSSDAANGGIGTRKLPEKTPSVRIASRLSPPASTPKPSLKKGAK